MASNNPNCASSSGLDALASVDDICKALPQARAAYLQLLAGKNAIEVRFNERWVSYGRGDAIALKQWIREAEAICGDGPDGRRFAVRASGPYARRHMPYGA
jgi:hypothetical protein